MVIGPRVSGFGLAEIKMPSLSSTIFVRLFFKGETVLEFPFPGGLMASELVA
jgi:hypothetical protein